MDKFNQQCLEQHNHWRGKHGVPALRHSAQLAQSAQKWANQLASMGQLQHSPDSQGKFGENVAMKWMQGGTEFPGDEVTDKWYSEIHDYTFGQENQINCGHFSQVVWKSTTEAGFGRAMDKTGKVFAVGQYLPPANYANKWNANVPPPTNGKIEVSKENEPKGSHRSSPSSSSSRSSGKKMHGELKPHNKDDCLVGKQTKTKISGAVKTIILTETYERPDGSSYTVTKETTGGSGAADPKEKPNTQQLNDLSNLPGIGGNDKKRSQDQPQASLDEFQCDVLEAHNAYRKIYRVPPLTCDEELNAIAQEWADHLARNNSFKHSTNTFEGVKLGENIACKWGTGVKGCQGREVVHQWYDEESKYTYGENPTSLEAGHFTQVVWKASSRLGVGFARANDGKFITVCNYYPPGNIMGQFVENVPRPQ